MFFWLFHVVYFIWRKSRSRRKHTDPIIVVGSDVFLAILKIIVDNAILCGIVKESGETSKGERKMNQDKFNQILEVVEQGGEWAHGGNLNQVAAEWYETGFTTSQVEEWLGCGCFDAQSAFQLDNEDITPEQANVRRDGLTIGYLYANGDLSLAKVKHYIDFCIA
jgi:hypothetical protein